MRSLEMADQRTQADQLQIVPDSAGRAANLREFCSIPIRRSTSRSPLEVMPLSERKSRRRIGHVVRRPYACGGRAGQFVPNLIAALQEHMRVFSETYTNVGWSKQSGPIH